MQPVIKKYEKQLIEDNVVNQEEWNQMKASIKERLNEAYGLSKSYQYDAEDWMTKEWEQIKEPSRENMSKDTGIDLAYLQPLGKKIATLPGDGKFHPQIQKIYNARAKSIEDGTMIDWGTSEALAFASLIDEGYHVRLSGQDVERGTFSHRHAHVFHQDKDGFVIPINNVSRDEGVRTFIASNSHLSEFAVLGYEYGYASTNPNTLSIWEAQFGDFSNGA